jgi:23S rRNA (pseudouridine1915-N3)-methyltransferase
MITILCVSDGPKHFLTPISEYEKRLQKHIIIKNIRPISHTNSEYIKIKETLLIAEALKKIKWTVWLLDERGISMTTNEFSEMIEMARIASESLIFIIGGSYGVDLEVFSKIPHKTLRLSDFVLPHGLAFLVLIEQIYRAHEIIKWSGYHHS